MRKVKQENLKAVPFTLSIPASLREYGRKNANSSELLQQCLAEQVLNVSFREHCIEYSGHTSEFKKESHSKSYIRAARWILESKINRIWVNQSADIYTLDVDWLLTGKKNMLVVCFLGGSGYCHVIYDCEIDRVNPELTEILSEETIKFGWKTYKARVLDAWIQSSWTLLNGGAVCQ